MVKNKIGINKKKNLPENIRNVALIVMPGNESYKNFMAMYREKCLGNLYIYHVNDSEDDIIKPISLFEEYHYIDIICIMTDDSYDNINLLSSSDVAKYILNRKSGTYILTICPYDLIIIMKLFH